MSFEHDPTPASEVVTLAPTLAPARVAQLKQQLLAYWAAPEETQEEDDAFNGLCETIAATLDEVCPNGDLLSVWEAGNLKATSAEIVVNGLDLLDQQAMQQQAWKEYQNMCLDVAAECLAQPHRP
jgi:hypothetical protein